MNPRVDTRDASAVESVVVSVFRRSFPGVTPAVIEQAFDWARDCFEGRYPGYQAIDARYHDFEHTLQGTLCLARLLGGYIRARVQPAISPRHFELAILAVLMHDTGYLKPEGDEEGTGAKFTLVHVARSAAFAEQLLSKHGFKLQEIAAVQHMIKCTGVNANLSQIPFADETERLLGFALATSDLLGQMAARDYVDKLDILFSEFEEAARFRPPDLPPMKGFGSAMDLRQQTPGFWKHYVLPKIQKEFLSLCDYLRDPWPDGPNPYLAAIESNIARLQEELKMVA
jgi:hypothetical protein